MHQAMLLPDWGPTTLFKQGVFAAGDLAAPMANATLAAAAGVMAGGLCASVADLRS